MFKIIKFIALLALLVVIGRTWGMDADPIDELLWALDRNNSHVNKRAPSTALALKQEALDKNLVTAARAGNYDQVKELLARGADADTEDISGLEDTSPLLNTRPLLFAIYHGNLQMCQLLIENGANVNMVQWASRETPLMQAINHGYYRICQLLIAHNANVNAQDKDGWTPLIWAAKKGYSRICQLLSEHGAKRTMAIVKLAIHLNNEDVIRAILAAIPPQSQKELLKIVSSSLLVIQKAEPRLPKDMQRFIQHPLINSMINDWVALNLKSIKKQTSRVLGQRDFNFWNQLRKDLQNNAMRVLFGAPRGFWTRTKETYKEEKVIKKITKDILKEEKEIYLRETAQSYYRILGVPTNATSEQINEAFAQRIQPYLHETYQTGISPEHKRLADAWSTLVDPKKREAYDQLLTIKE